jgi:hypothetical protein
MIELNVILHLFPMKLHYDELCSEVFVLAREQATLHGIGRGNNSVETFLI